MADKKISALTAATTPLAGTEVLPIVQSGSTVKVAVSNLTAGRAVSADSLALTGSPLPVTSGGTGLASYTQYGVFYANTTTSVSTAGKLTFDGKDFGVGNSRVSFGANISGITLDNTGANQHITWRVNSVTQASAYTNGTSGFIFGTESNTPLQFQIGGVVKAELQTDGDLSVGNGNFVPATAAKGVNFTANTPAAGMTSQLLNWYEEGTWTPVYTPSSGAFGTIGAVTSGRYRRIGKTVFFWADIRTTGTPDLGTASGQLYITGLPFTASADGGYGQVSIMQKWNLGTAFTNIGVVVDASNTRLYFTKNSSNSAITYIQATELSTATDNFGNLMGIFGMYTV